MVSSSSAWRGAGGGGASSVALACAAQSLLPLDALPSSRPPPPPPLPPIFFFWLSSAAASGVAAWGLWHALRRRRLLFVGAKLREADIERLEEEAWKEFRDLLLSLIVFRSQISVHFLSSLFVLLCVKAMHSLAFSSSSSAANLLHLHSSSSSSSSSSASTAAHHLRIAASLAILLLLDFLLLFSSIHPPPAAAAPSLLLLFPFEYTILAASTFASLLQFAFHSFLDGRCTCFCTFDSSVLSFYLELLRDIARFALYLLFSLLVFLKYGFPLHLIREVYINSRRVKCRLSELRQYQKTTSDMNERFPDATKNELRKGDAMCIICREEMVMAKKLQCDHKFHVRCLRSWLERQQACPICRAPVST